MIAVRKGTGPAPRILQIEDDPAAQRLVERVLGAAGMEVRTVADGLGGIAEAMGWRPDLVLVDINIPNLDGYEVVLHLRGESGLGDVPIVAITAEGERDTSLAVGFDGFVLKPIDVAAFPRLVRRYLAGKRDAPPADPAVLRRQTQRIVRRLEEKVRALEEANDRLEAARKAREEFYRNVSHEMMTPLVPLSGFMRLLSEERVGPLNRAQRDAVDGAERAAQRIRGLLTNLLDVSALALGQVTPAPRRFVVSDVFDALAADVAAACEEKGLALEVAVPERDVAFVGDPDRIVTVFRHLLDNSLKFTPAGGGVRIEVSLDRGEMLGFVVDTGIGIPQAEQRRIFEAFYQVDGTPTRAHGGIGVGLAVARDFVRLMEGTIWVESPPKSRPAPSLTPGPGVDPGGGHPGALFGVRIPAARPAPARAGGASHPA